MDNRVLCCLIQVQLFGCLLSCLPKEVLLGGPCLQNLSLQLYLGPGLLDANGQIMKPFGTITAPLVVGQLSLSHIVEFIIIDALPYSCIIGLSFLNTFSQ